MGEILKKGNPCAHRGKLLKEIVEALGSKFLFPGPSTEVILAIADCAGNAQFDDGAGSRLEIRSDYTYSRIFGELTRHGQTEMVWTTRSSHQVIIKETWSGIPPETTTVTVVAGEDQSDVFYPAVKNLLAGITPGQKKPFELKGRKGLFSFENESDQVLKIFLSQRNGGPWRFVFQKPATVQEMEEMVALLDKATKLNGPLNMFGYYGGKYSPNGTAYPTAGDCILHISEYVESMEKSLASLK